MECRCSTVERLEGAEAAEYLAKHLHRLTVDNRTWDAIYRCPTTAVEWIESYPRSELQGGGPPVLVRRAASST